MPGTYVQQTWQYSPALDAPARYRRACHYKTFIPNQLAGLTLHLDGELVGIVSDAERELRRLNEEGGPLLDPLGRLLLRTESIASSRIEGLQVDVRQLARAEAKSESGLDVATTATDILSNIDAMMLAVDDAARAPVFDESQIVAIHKRLLERAPHRHIAGQVRDSQNWIGGNNYNPCDADFVPPPPEEVGRLLRDLCAAVNDDVLSPMVQAALVHAQFETIHPFADGNGRTGRALVHVIFRRRGIAPRFIPPISVVFANQKKRYIDGLTQFRGDGVARWIEQFAVATLQAAGLAGQHIERVMALRDEWRAKLAALPDAPRADAAAWAIIDILPGQPMVSGPVAIALTKRNKARVYEGIAALERAGVLRPLSLSKRNRIWEAVGLLDLVAQLEEGQSPH